MKKIFYLFFILILALSFGACGSGDDKTYSIQGTVTFGNNVLSNVTIALSGDSTSSTTTDTDGRYSFSKLDKGDYTITPSLAGYLFTPTSISATISNANVTGKDFVAAGAYSIQGTITVGGTALPYVTVALSGASSSSATTDAAGNYAFSGLLSGDYTVTPSTATGYTFVPVNIAATIGSASLTGKDFVGTQISAARFLHYTLPDQYDFLANNPGATIADEATILFSGYTLTNGIDYGGGTLVSGYALDQFVDEDAVIAATPDPDGVLGTNDARELYTAVVYSHPDDGAFSIRSKFLTSGLYEPDLRWDLFITGYLLDLNNNGKTYFPSDAIIKRHDTKNANDIYMFRKIDVKRPDAAGTIVTFEPQATIDNYLDDTTYTTTTTLTTTKFNVATMSFGDYKDVKAISLDQFLTTYVTNTPGSYTYKIVPLNDTYKEGWTYANMQHAYYLPDLDLIIQVDSSNAVVSNTKINYPVRIELISGSPVEYDYAAANPPAFVPNE
jgi:hypothetical protein